MSRDNFASRRIDLNRGLRSLAGASERTRLEAFLDQLGPLAPRSKWRILTIEESDPLRERMVEAYRTHQRAGDLQLRGPLTRAELHESLTDILKGVSIGGSVWVHFQESERIGLLRIDLDLPHSLALDLLAYDRDGILLSEQTGRWGVLLDRTADESGESFELVTWGFK